MNEQTENYNWLTYLTIAWLIRMYDTYTDQTDCYYTFLSCTEQIYYQFLLTRLTDTTDWADWPVNWLIRLMDI